LLNKKKKIPEGLDLFVRLHLESSLEMSFKKCHSSSLTEKKKHRELKIMKK
jgi:hypothetical protein